MTNLEALSIRYKDNKLEILDQQQLPHKEIWLEASKPVDMVNYIKALKIRGAPLIAMGAVLSLAKYAKDGASHKDILTAADQLRASRPTAVNLMNALDELLENGHGGDLTADLIVTRAEKIFKEDTSLCNQMADNGLHLLEPGDNILTHCNTGGLATAGVGTALGLIKKAHQFHKDIHVYVDETRPLLQGGRLTTWELDKAEIPYTLICDNMAAFLMQQGKVSKVLVGADRIATNGDFANKVGTYNLAVLAHYHNIPFYVVAPYTTIDINCDTGAHIPIEERKAAEVQGVSGSFGSVQWSPDCKTYNPAFDITPVKLVTGFVCDKKYYTKEDLFAGQLQDI